MHRSGDGGRDGGVTPQDLPGLSAGGFLDVAGKAVDPYDAVVLDHTVVMARCFGGKRGVNDSSLHSVSEYRLSAV